MSMTADKLSEAYFEKARSNTTWSGLPLEEFYGPADAAGVDYARQVADPGQFPYTRGIHANMYRGKYWTRREVCGFATAADTNQWFRFQMAEGVSGLDYILDVPGHMGLDADHPYALAENGVTGVSCGSLRDMEDLLDGIPLDRVSMVLLGSGISAACTLAQHLTIAERQGVDFAKLRGTTQNENLHIRYCGFRPSVPLDLGPKMVVDIIEYATRHIPHWYPTTPNLYDMREQGISAAQEIAFGLAIAACYVQKTVERGLPVDDFAPRLSFYCSCHIDLFEEVAKLRAARRLWARIMGERFGAQNPRSMQFRFAVHTAGCSLVPQQPLNNIVRVAYEALAAVLAGCQSLHCCSYDEPIALPSELSQRTAIRTQQILAYETGVANVSDPLGGSYYVESLTDRIQAEAERIMAEIDRQGGIVEAMRTEWIDREIEKAALENQRAVDRGEKVIVGVNAFRSEEETATPGGVKRIPHEVSEELARRTRALKETRDNSRVRAAIAGLRREAERGEQHNLLPAIVECVKAYATNAEIIGTIREVYGHHYDPLEVISSPF